MDNPYCVANLDKLRQPHEVSLNQNQTPLALAKPGELPDKFQHPKSSSNLNMKPN